MGQVHGVGEWPRAQKRAVRGFAPPPFWALSNSRPHLSSQLVGASLFSQEGSSGKVPENLPGSSLSSPGWTLAPSNPQPSPTLKPLHEHLAENLQPSLALPVACSPSTLLTPSWENGHTQRFLRAGRGGTLCQLLPKSVLAPSSTHEEQLSLRSSLPCIYHRLESCTLAGTAEQCDTQELIP